MSKQKEQSVEWSNRKSLALLQQNQRVIPGGVVSVNRKINPVICFSHGQGCRVWDEDGNAYIDYHGGFSPVLLGHNDPDVDAAVRQMMDRHAVHMGSGTTWYEGKLASLLVEHIPAIDSVQMTNTGSEATAHAIRLARAYTGRDDLVLVQGSYNGAHNDVMYNMSTPLTQIGPRVCPGEYQTVPISAGIPSSLGKHIHVINFNDLDSVRYVCEHHAIAGLVTEPILQNIGVVKPVAGYLEGLRELADRYGFVLIFDEVKTGFRHSLGGYQQLSGVRADLSSWAKAVANGYPMGFIGGKREIMDLFVDPDPGRRVLIAGTYNAHPIATAAAIATVEKLVAGQGDVYRHLYAMGERMQVGLERIFRDRGIPVAVARQGSAFCVYFMDREPRDWHDLAQHHDSKVDEHYRMELIKQGVYHFPLPTKQGSICFAHAESDIDQTLEITNCVVAAL